MHDKIEEICLGNKCTKIIVSEGSAIILYFGHNQNNNQLICNFYLHDDSLMKHEIDTALKQNKIVASSGHDIISQLGVKMGEDIFPYQSIEDLLDDFIENGYFEDC